MVIKLDDPVVSFSTLFHHHVTIWAGLDSFNLEGSNGKVMLARLCRERIGGFSWCGSAIVALMSTKVCGSILIASLQTPSLWPKKELEMISPSMLTLESARLVIL